MLRRIISKKPCLSVDSVATGLLLFLYVFLLLFISKPTVGEIRLIGGQCRALPECSKTIEETGGCGVFTPVFGLLSLTTITKVSKLS